MGYTQPYWERINRGKNPKSLDKGIFCNTTILRGMLRINVQLAAQRQEYDATIYF
jgi:hypothetical protein